MGVMLGNIVVSMYETRVHMLCMNSNYNWTEMLTCCASVLMSVNTTVKAICC